MKLCFQREIVSLHIGQAGNQIGFANWELLCAEHGIGRDGKLNESKEDSDRCFSSFFTESHIGKFVPRGLFIDLEPTVIGDYNIQLYTCLPILLRSIAKGFIQRALSPSPAY